MKTARDIYHRIRRKVRMGRAWQFQNNERVEALPKVHHLINQLANMKANISLTNENGKVAFIMEGMDCDGQYRSVRIIDAPIGPFVWLLSEYHRSADVEGEEFCYFDFPHHYTEGDADIVHTSLKRRTP